MRRSVTAARPLFALLCPCAFAALAPLLLAGGCAGSTDAGQTHGPTYDFEGGSSSLAEGAVSDDDAPFGFDDAWSGDAPISRDAGAVDSGDASALEPEDAGDASATSDAAVCRSTIAVLAGGATSLAGAVATGNGSFTAQTLTGSLAYAPTLAPTASGFEGLFAASGGALFGAGLVGTTWSFPAALGGGASAIDAPALTPLGATLQAVYLSPQNLYFHAQFDGTSWDTGGDAVLPRVDGGAQSFGPVRASAAGSATELVIAYEGDDAHLYVQSWTLAGGWQAAIKIGTGKVETNTAPAIVALNGGTSDLLVVYPVSSTTSTNYLNYALRDGTSKAWSATTLLTNIAAYTPNAPSLAAMSGGRAIVGWRGGNGLPYTMEFTPTPTAAWSTPTPIGSINVDAAPSLATGVCGNDAVAVLASNGAVTVADYAAGAWVPPTPIAGISGASFAAIATQP